MRVPNAQTAHDAHTARVAAARSAYDVAAAAALAVFKSGGSVDSTTYQASLNSAQSTKDTIIAASLVTRDADLQELRDLAWPQRVT
jgi:hypothetical protein